MKARPTIGHWLPRERGGTDQLENLRPESHLCNEQGRNLTPSPMEMALLKRKMTELKRDQKRLLASWLLADRRTYSPVDWIWAEVVQLPGHARHELREHLATTLGQ